MVNNGVISLYSNIIINYVRSSIGLSEICVAGSRFIHGNVQAARKPTRFATCGKQNGERGLYLWCMGSAHAAGASALQCHNHKPWRNHRDVEQNPSSMDINYLHVPGTCIMKITCSS